MNKVKRLLVAPQTYFMLATLIVLAMIWLFIPHIVIANHHFLQTISMRALATAIIFGFWFNYFLLKTILAKKVFFPTRNVGFSSTERASLLEQTILADLKQDCLQVMRTAEKHCPWFLLIGSAGCGKTSFLQQLPFQLISPQRMSLTHTKTTQWVDWWVSEQAIFIDPSHQIALSQMNEPPTQVIWRSLISILKKNQRRIVLNDVLLMVDVPTLANVNSPIFSDWIEDLIYQLQLLKSLQRSLTVTLIITQSDRIVGFNEFFDDLQESERKQACGFSIMTSDDLVQQVDKQLDEFVRSLSARSLWRMHHEHSLHKRGQIQQFPLQMEKLVQHLKIISSQLPWSRYLRLNGIYFVSSLQQKSVIDFLNPVPLSQKFGLQKHIIANSYHEQFPYFIDQLILRLIAENRQQKNNRPRLMSAKFFGLLASAGVIAGLTLFWHYSYQHNVRTLNQLLLTLRQPQEMTPETVILPWLSQLNHLHDTIDTLLQQKTSLDPISGLDQSAELLSVVREHYIQSLQQVFLPNLLQTLSTVILQSKHQDEIALYNALKVYLALANRATATHHFIEIWFLQYWQQQFSNNPKLQQQLMTHLQQLLRQKWTPWPINEVLVDQAQQELRQLSRVKRAFLKLQALYPLAPVPILTGLTKIEGVDVSRALICSFCTTERFQSVYAIQIPKIVRSFSEANLILATPASELLTPVSQAKLIEQLQRFYLNYYRQQWMEALPNIQIVPAKTLLQAQHVIALLRDTQSEFWKVLRIVYDNATLSQFQPAPLDANNPKIQTLRILLNEQSDLRQETQYALMQLSNYLSQLQQTTEVDKASYLAAVARFQSAQQNSMNHEFSDHKTDLISGLLAQVERDPILLQPWLQSVIEGAWQAILNNAHEYLNTIWSTTITPEYRELIAHRYPVFHNSANDISLNNFTQFFGPGGTLEHFFNQYLKPFVNIEQNYWTFKTLDHQSIGISQQVLDMLIRASLIQQMFYTDDHQKLSVHFTLMPMRLSQTANNVTLNLGSQLLQFDRDVHVDSAVFWPPQNPFITLLFNGIEGGAPNMTLSGPWALFRLFDQSDLTATKNPREYKLRLQLKEYTADYLLVTQHLINPFIPGILTKFRCPSKL